MLGPTRIFTPGTATLALALLCSVTLAGGPDRVWLTNGGVVDATIDPRTDADCLWLTTSLRHGSLVQSIPWHRVSEVELGSHTYEARVVRTAVETIRDASPGHRAGDTPRLTTLDSSSLATPAHRLPSAASSPISVRSTTSRTPIQALAVSAGLGNWDQDAAIDGLWVELTPYDFQGNPVTCNGTVTLTLRAWETTERSHRLGSHRERWIRNIETDESDSGTVLRLPFRVIRPQASSDWWSHGVLHVRLSVPGSGVIERTLTDVRLRPFEPMRDLQEQRVGHRALPGENVRRHAWYPSEL